MNGVLAWALIVLSLAIVVVRRRSVALVAVTTQAGLLAIFGLAHVPGRSIGFLIAALVLVAKALAIGFGLRWTLRRTREDQPIAERPSGPARLLLAATGLIVAVALVPGFGIGGIAIERGAVGLVAGGILIVFLRKPTLFQAIGLIVAENGIAFAATSVPHGLPSVIDIGAVFDLLVVIAAAVAFHERIFTLFGSGDSAALSELRD
jgi:hydrogenase-4 component E